MVTDHIAQPAGGYQMLDIAAMSRPLRDDHFGGPFAPAQLDNGGNHVGMRVDHFVAMIFDDVGFKDNAFTCQRDVLAKILILASEHIGQVGVVVARRGDVHATGSGCLTQPSGGFHAETAHE